MLIWPESLTRETVARETFGLVVNGNRFEEHARKDYQCSVLLFLNDICFFVSFVVTVE